MKIIDVVELTNGTRTMPDVAKELGISKDTLRRRLNSLGYKYDNSLKKTVYVGEESEKKKIDELLFSEIIHKKEEKNPKKEENSQKKVRGNSEEKIETFGVNEIKVGEKSEKNQNDFTESEIFALKELLHISKSNEARLFLELSSLPESKETRKSSIVIGKDIHDQFEKFSKSNGRKRVSKFSLIELALYEFMYKYN
ncbi:hypothetical protein [Bacillus sp. FSL R9-9410]|uniref:hypothetical protein n=1 Tax=Bacillus sp. FSL R9-9410 TaxID=2921590 RepID=UPI0031019245